jgi:hypothetical protein
MRGELWSARALAEEEDVHAESRRRAVRVVAGRAVDADDCRLLLEMLGLERDAGLTSARPFDRQDGHVREQRTGSR